VSVAPLLLKTGIRYNYLKQLKLYICYCEQYRTPQKVDLLSSSGGEAVSDEAAPLQTNPCSNHEYFGAKLFLLVYGTKFRSRNAFRKTSCTVDIFPDGETSGE
jgi:hypothetical protein